MLDYFALYSTEEKKCHKSTISHRIAIALAKYFPSFLVDIDYNKADILVHKNGERDILAIFWSNTYLTAEEKERAQNYHLKNKPNLTLAFSLLEEKGYILIYRFEDNYLEYLHINKDGFSERLLKKCIIKDEKEPSLFSSKKRKTKTQQDQ